VILLCLGCTIFCITDVSTEDDFNAQNKDENMQESNGTVYAPPPVGTGKESHKAAWDPEKGATMDVKNSDGTDQSEPIAVLTTDTQNNIIPSISDANNADNPPVDLLDTEIPEIPTKSTNVESSIDELD